MNDITHRTARPSANLPWPPVAIAAWLVPGLGHWLLGYRARGVIVGITLLALFIAGLLIGGIDVIDRQRDRLWFAGQVLIGPVALAVSEAHVRIESARPPAPPTADRPRPGFQRSVGRVNELGTLYCTLAGVLNLLVILDAVGRATEP